MFRCALVGFCLLAFLEPLTARAAPLKFYADVNFFRNGRYHFTNVPLEVRDIPRHKDDGYLVGSANDSAIVVDHVGMTPFGLGVRAQVVTRSAPVDLGVGISARVVFSSGRVQQNQFGTTARGYGTSLRYFDVQETMPWISTRLAMSTGLTFPVSGGRQLRLEANGEFDPIGVPLEFESGWDRFDKDEEWRDFALGRIHEHSASFRLTLFSALIRGHRQYDGYFVEVGRSWRKFDPNERFSNVRFSDSDRWRVAIGVSGLDH